MIKRKGESLIEVLVALSIFMLIFSGVVTMVVGSVTLNLSSRKRTEAVATIQKNLNEDQALNANTTECTIPTRAVGSTLVEGIVNGSAVTVASFSNCSTIDSVDDYCYWTEVKALDSTEVPLATQPAKSYVKLESHGRWYTRMIGVQEFYVSKLIENN